MDNSARELIRLRLSQAKAFLAQETPPRLSESDTKANFIEPIIAALGWEGIGVVTREYYVRNSQEFIDYVMSEARGPLLAIEAKPLQAELTEKHAAQLIQYCAVEGIEWAALTNGRELQFFNTFLKPDLAAKRILRIDLLAFNAEPEFEQLFEQLWQLSRERMTQPAGVRSWLNQRRLDSALRELMTNPNSAIMRQLKKELVEKEIAATPQEVSHWFRTHLLPPVVTLNAPPKPSLQNIPSSEFAAVPRTSLPTVAKTGAPGIGGTTALMSRGDMRPLEKFLRTRIDGAFPGIEWRETKSYTAAGTESGTFLALKERAGRLIVGLALPPSFQRPGIRDVGNVFNWDRITKVFEVRTETDLSESIMEAIAAARAHVESEGARTVTVFGVSLSALMSAGAISPGAELVLLGNGRREAARASIDGEGFIVWEGQRFRSPSDRVFGSMLGRASNSINGWSRWHVLEDGRLRSIADIRKEFLSAKRGRSVEPGAIDAETA